MNEVATGLQAAWLLARGHAGGLALLDDAPDGMAAATRSFWAVALCLPAFICLHVLDWVQDGVPPHPGHGFALDLLSYAIGWVGFVLISHRLSHVIGRDARWPRFITAWNWCNVVQYVMLVVAALPSLLGLPDMVAQLVWLVAMGWALWLEWFATRLALDITGLQAAGMVALDIALGLFLVGITNALV